MKRVPFLFTLLVAVATSLTAQTASKQPVSPKVEVYYFHITERCEIDQTIESNTRALMKSDFQNEIKNGTIKFAVLNTDDKANAKTVSRFEINPQALYVVKHDGSKEAKTDLTRFAFDNVMASPKKFQLRLKDEIEKALK
jgi:hypothetical protein